MALTARERKELFSETKDRLSKVIGASGKAEELVRLTTQIVQACKKLLNGAPEGLRARSTATLAEFVVSAKKIAQDTRAVDSASLQKLSSSRKAVDLLVDELDAWHSSKTSVRDEVDISLDNILGTAPPDVGVSGGGVGRKTSPTDRGRRPNSMIGGPPVVSEHERRLVAELKSQHDMLARKKEPEQYPTPLQGNTEDTLKMVVSGLSRNTSQLTDQSSQRAPSKESLVDPAITVARLICTLLDVVDNLFVTKFPMRPQVHAFSCAIVEHVLLYGNQSKSDDTASLRIISTQIPALMNALEVMVEQTFERSQDVKRSQEMSLQRKADLRDLDVNGPGHSPRVSPVNPKRKDPPPTPPSKTPVVQEFEVFCMICTSVAVDANTKALLNKGSEITLKVKPNTTVFDVRKMLVERTSIPLEDIQLKFRGDDVLADNARMTSDNPVPYFVFNLHEPGDEEMTEFRREQRRKNRLRIDTTDWSRVPSPVAVAVYDYEAMAEPGEDENLEFEEGDLIEIVEQSADGWWTGRVEGKVGVFPASFVEMIHIPKTKDERKKLLKRFHQGRLGELGNGDADVEEPAPPSRPPPPKLQQPPQQQETPAPPQQQFSSSYAGSEVPSSRTTRSGSFSKGMNRSHRASTSSDTDGSPSPTKKPNFGRLDRNTSEPSVSMADRDKDGKQKKKRSLFKKKTPPSYMALTDDFQRSPILARRDSSETREIIPELEEELQPPVRPSPPATAAAPSSNNNPPSTSMHQSATVPARLFKPKSSPRLVNKPGRAGGPGDNKSLPSPLQRRGSEDKFTGSGEHKGGVGKLPEGSTSSKPTGKTPSSRRPPPPPPPPYAKRYGAGGMQKLVKKNSEGGGDEDDKKSEESPQLPSLSHRGSVSSTGKNEDDKDDGGLVMMMVTPASPLVREREEDGKASREEEEVSLPPVSSSNSMEDLFKNLEEFDELSSTHSLNNGHHQSQQKDYTSIPQEELKGLARNSIAKEEELPRSASVPAETNVLPMMEDRPCLTPSPLGTSNETSSTATRNNGAGGQPDETSPTSSEPIYAIPMKPPRSRSKKNKTRHGDYNEAEESEPQTRAPPPPPSAKPQPPPPFSKPQVPAPYGKSQAPPKSVSSSALNRPLFKVPKPPPKPPSPGLPEEGTAEEEAAASRGGRSGPKVDNSSPTAPPRRKSRPPKSTSDLSAGAGKPSLRPKPPQMSRMQVDVVLKKQMECASAPVSRTSSPDDATDQQRLRQEASTSTTNLASSRASKNPVGRTNSSELVDHEADNCTGVSKEGMLHLESRDQWRPRYFQLQQNSLAYFDISAPADSANPLGQFATSKVDEVVHIGEKNRLHCFSLKMQGDKSVVLGCNSKTEMEDWMKSINKVARQSKRRGRTSVSGSSQSVCYKTAVRCISYLSSSHLVRRKKLISPATGNPVLIKKLLAAIDNSEEVDLNSLEEAESVLGLLLSLFGKAYLGSLIAHELAEQMCSAMQSADAITAMASQLEKLPPKSRELFKKLLRFFSKIINYSDKNNTGVQDINTVFGPVVFENITPSQSEPLLAYLISTCEFIIT